MDNKRNGTTQDLLTFDLDSVVTTGMIKNRHRFKILALVAGIISMCAIVTCVFLFAILPMIHYNDACALFEQGQYEAARASFEALGDYKDSPANATKSSQYIRLQKTYESANALWQKGELDNAIDKFTSILDFKDSANCIEQIKQTQLQEMYASATEEWKNGSLETALEKFEAISAFEDASDCATKVRGELYNQAVTLLENEQFGEAKAKFTLLGNYPNVAEKMELVAQGETYQAALFAETDSIATALELYQQLPIDYKDVSARIERINLYIDYAGLYYGNPGKTDISQIKPHEDNKEEFIIYFIGTTVQLKIKSVFEGSPRVYDGYVFDGNVATQTNTDWKTGVWDCRMSYIFKDGYVLYQQIYNDTLVRPYYDIYNDNLYGRYNKIQ